MDKVECILERGASLPLCDSRIAELHQYWRSIHPSSTSLPGRQHFDPLMVPHLLPWIWLLDVLHEPLRFKYRLCGTEIVSVIGYDPTGHWIDNSSPQLADKAINTHYCAAAEQGMVCYRRGFPVLDVQKNFMVIERLFLPLAKDGTDVDMLLAMNIYSTGNAANDPGTITTTNWART